MIPNFDVSFVIPNFNSGTLLKDTINSIISKKLNFSYEILVIDGNSTDDSILFLQSNKINNLKFISETDINVYDAMNKGILLSRGGWLLFLGAGDLLSDSFYDFTFNYLEDTFLLYGNVYWVSKNLIYDGFFNKKKIYYKNICQQAIFYNKICFKKYGLFDIKFKIAADYKFNLNIFINDHSKVRFVNIVFANYKGDGISHFNKDLFTKVKNIYILTSLLKSYRVENILSMINYLLYLIFNKIINIFKRDK
jgi:glycosyltransferase involved in cell wall biosynthesis